MVVTLNPLPVLSLLVKLGVEIASNSNEEIAAHCPFHKDSHPSFSMNNHTGLWICYQCSRAGTMPMLIEALGGKGTNTAELIRDIRYQAAKPKPKMIPLKKELEIVEDLDVPILYALYESFKEPPEWALQERKFGPGVAQQYGIKWDRGWIIPIWSPEITDEIDDLWGWQFKRLDFVSNYPKAIKKSRTLFGVTELESKTVVLVESPLDVARLAAVGVSAVATFGAYVSNFQLRLLIEEADRIIMALDNDEEGQRQSAKIYRRLAKQVSTRIAQFPAGCKDPGDLSDKQVTKVFHDV